MIGSCIRQWPPPGLKPAGAVSSFLRYTFIAAALLGADRVAQAVTDARDYAVLVSAAVQSSPPQITLLWPQDTFAVPTSYEVSRKAPEARTWTVLATLSGNQTNYVDATVATGTKYEYQVKKTASDYLGYGYVMSGIAVPLREDRGKMILIVDNTYASDLSNELARLEQDLAGDGWQVLRHDVNRTDAPPSVKALILSDYNADPANVRSVFLFGHAPVPYSGDIVPDGHTPNHRGAWPADLYYADLDYTWGDALISDQTASDPRQFNVPGDGKFDVSTVVTLADLEVGRVDLANLPQFAKSEKELLRQYLNKDHNFRHKLITAQPRGVVSDFFGTFSGSAFAATGWRNFAAFFGASNVVASSDWYGTLTNGSYLWGYGCGGGTFTSVDGVTTTAQEAANDPKVIFTFLFGSYFGDWDTTNNVMRGALATPTYTLTSAWAGRPHWFAHHMGLGETIGYSTRQSQINNNSSAYKQINPGSQQIHIALMGDPALRLHPIAPPTGASAETADGKVTIIWTNSTEAVLGYYVYAGAAANGPFTRITADLLQTNSFTAAADSSNSVYMVRAVRLENSASGTYYNASQGAFTSVAATPVPRLEITHSSDRVVELGTNWDFAAPITSGGCEPIATSVFSTVTNVICGSSFTATRVWQFVDDCGTTLFSTNSVTVTDTTAPSLSVPSQKTIEAGNAWSFDAPTGTDLGGPVTFTVVGMTTNLGPGNLITATCVWQGTDPCGNSDQIAQTVTMVDTTAPTLSHPADKVVELGSNWTFDTPDATDAGGPVSLAISSLITNSAHGMAPTITCTWLATDSSGNSAQTSQSVTIVDTTAPTLVPAADKTVNEGEEWSFDQPGFSDASGEVNLQVLTVITNQTSEGTAITCTWLASDPCGNAKQCSQTVTILSAGPVVVSVIALSDTAYEAGDTVAFEFSRSGCLAKPVTIKLAYSGAAEYGVDYLELPVEILIPAGEKSVTLNLEAIGDTLVEKAEDVTVTIRGGEGFEAVGNPEATINIYDTTAKRKGDGLIRPGRF